MSKVQCQNALQASIAQNKKKKSKIQVQRNITTSKAHIYKYRSRRGDSSHGREDDQLDVHSLLSNAQLSFINEDEDEQIFKMQF